MPPQQAQVGSGSAAARPRRVWRGLRLAACNPATTLVAAAGVLISAWIIANEPQRDRSTVGRWIARHVLGRVPVSTSSFMMGGAPALYFVKEGGSIRVHDPEVESWNGVSKALTAGDVPVASGAFDSTERRTGLWALTTHERTSRIDVIPLTGDWSPDEQRAAWRMYAERRGGPAAAAANGPVTERTPIVSGYIHNALALASLGVFLVSLAWVPRAPGWWRARRRLRAIARGRCPWCGYSIAGLAGGDSAMCPECGRTRDAPAAARSGVGDT